VKRLVLGESLTVIVGGIAVGLVAAAVAARQASRVDPIVALRQE